MFFGNPPPFHRVTGKFCLFFLLFCLEKKARTSVYRRGPLCIFFQSLFFLLFFLRALSFERMPSGKIEVLHVESGGGEKKRGREICTSCTDFSIYFLLCRCVSVRVLRGRFYSPCWERVNATEGSFFLFSAKDFPLAQDGAHRSSVVLAWQATRCHVHVGVHVTRVSGAFCSGTWEKAPRRRYYMSQVYVNFNCNLMKFPEFIPEGLLKALECQKVELCQLQLEREIDLNLK